MDIFSRQIMIKWRQVLLRIFFSSLAKEKAFFATEKKFAFNIYILNNFKAWERYFFDAAFVIHLFLLHKKGKLNFRRKEIFSLFKQSKKISNSLETEITSKLYFRSGPIKKVYFKYSFWMGYKVENESLKLFFERNSKLQRSTWCFGEEK